MPVADHAWRLCFAKLDALNLNLYEDGRTLWMRCDVYDAGRSVESVDKTVLTFTVADAFGRSRRVYCRVKSEEACHRWIEAIYQARAFRTSWTLTSYPTAEAIVCCCNFGQNLLAHVFWFVVGNFLAVLLDMSAFVWDMVTNGGSSSSKGSASRRLQTKVDVTINTVMILGLLSMLCVLYGTSQPMATVLRRVRILCFVLAAASGAVIVAGMVSYAQEAQETPVSHVLRRRLFSVVDVIILATWINGAYLCTRALKVLRQDITRHSLTHV